MSALADRLQKLRLRIATAAARRGRSAADVKLLAVTKTQPPEQVLAAVALGLRAFGENRVQEAQRKLPEVTRACGVALEWHLVGRLQRNKARAAAELFDVIHSVDRIELAEALARAAEACGRRPRVLLQVELDLEPQKGGAAPEELPELAAAVDALPALELVGLMAIPRPTPDPEDMRPSFARLRALRDALAAGRGRSLPELSMGMSADFEVAIAEGATLVRVGTAIFGERRPG